MPDSPQRLPGVDIPKGRDWAYFVVMACSAAFFGGIVLHLLHKYDPIGVLMNQAPTPPVPDPAPLG